MLEVQKLMNNKDFAFVIILSIVIGVAGGFIYSQYRFAPEPSCLIVASYPTAPIARLANETRPIFIYLNVTSNSFEGVVLSCVGS